MSKQELRGSPKPFKLIRPLGLKAIDRQLAVRYIKTLFKAYVNRESLLNHSHEEKEENSRELAQNSHEGP